MHPKQENHTTDRKNRSSERSVIIRTPKEPETLREKHTTIMTERSATKSPERGAIEAKSQRRDPPARRLLLFTLFPCSELRKICILRNCLAKGQCVHQPLAPLLYHTSPGKSSLFLPSYLVSKSVNHCDGDVAVIKKLLNLAQVSGAPELFDRPPFPGGVCTHATLAPRGDLRRTPEILIYRACRPVS